MPKITVLGMGAMGSLMAMSLLKAEHEVTIWNRSAEKTRAIVKAGAKVAQTPYLAVRDADFVVSMVRDDEASKQVWLSNDGALAGMNENSIAIESSTLSVGWIEKLNLEFTKQKIAFIDAPVLGTRPQAKAAQLIYFVGGEVEICDRAKPILHTMGSVVHQVGSIGSGMTLKLAVNSLFAIQVSAMGELISLINKSGIEKTKALEIISATPVCSPAAKTAATAMIAGKFAPLFPISLVEKDLSYILKTAQDNEAKLPLVEANRQIYATAIDRGYGDNNITGVAKLYI